MGPAAGPAKQLTSSWLEVNVAGATEAVPNPGRL